MSDLPEKTAKPSSSAVDYEKLNDVQKMYVRRFERFNKSRAKTTKYRLNYARNIGIGVVSLAVGTYLYTIFAMKQIKLGPEFDQRLSDFEDKNDSSK
ncbi:hypothetical protein ACF0H5_012517 [Mactra antiquata]